MIDATRVAIALAIAAGGSAVATTPDEPFEDPAPPAVHALAPMPAPRPAPYAGLAPGSPPRPLAPGAVTGDWPGFLGPSRDGHSPETPLRRDFGDAGPRLVWTMERGTGYACPAIRGDVLVFTHREGSVAHIDCVHAETGERFWRFSYPCDYRGRYISNGGPRATPIIDGDRVYVHGVEGVLHCLDLATGRVVWKRDVSKDFGIPDQFFGVVASPIVYGDLLIQNIGAPGGPCVAAFDKRTGRLVWGTGGTWGPGCASPVIADAHGRPRLFVVTGGDSRPPTGGLMVVDPANGAIDFAYPFRSRTYESVNGASPVVGGDRVFITASYNTGTAALALAPDGGFTEAWKTRRLGLQFSTPIFVNGHLYAIDGRSDRAGAVVCLDPATGEELSRTDLTWDETIFYRGAEKTLPQSIGEGSLLYADGHGLCLGDNGHLLWLELRPTGVKVVARVSLFRANESWTPPALSRGLLYVCQNNRERFGRDPAPRRLLCFDLRAGAER